MFSIASLMSNNIQIYQKRNNAVIDYISKHLDKSFSLEELAAVAHFSSYHFHRIFVALMGESVNFYTNRLRLEKAARLLKFSSDPITQIAFSCGFSSAATFSRSFKNYFEISPSKYRKVGNVENSKNCKELFPMEQYLVPMSKEEKIAKFPVVIKGMEVRNVAYIRVLDSYREGVVIEAFEKLVAWAKKENLYNEANFFGMSLDDPMVTPKEKYRYEVCLAVPANMKVNAEDEVQFMQLPKCKYATTKVSGNINIVATATSYLFNEWLMNSPYEPDHQYGLELFLDKENMMDWSHFELELCIPIKSLKKY